MKLEYTIETVADPKSGTIMQRWLEDRKNEIARWVIETREAGVEQALIDLGWTPPWHWKGAKITQGS